MKTRYISTRRKSASLHFGDVMLRGLAPDGGLYIPEQYPAFSPELLKELKGQPYRRVAFRIMSLFATDIPQQALYAAMEKVYNGKVFRGADDVVSLRKIGTGVSLLDLNAGPSLAFKDLALQALGELFTYKLEASNTTMNIVGATTGDTGSAAIHAVRGKKRAAIFMLSPQKGMSGFQRAQMFTVKDTNVINIEVKASFDTCQDMVKAVNEDTDFRKEYRIGAVNSINLARIMLQVIYYVYSYLKVAPEIGVPVSYVVPSGNFGNICAGHVARMMGLPVGRLILASNENDVLVDFFTDGVYRPRPDAEVVLASSPSMNITKASNLERFVFDLFERGRDGRAGKTRELYDRLKQEGSFSIAREDLLRAQNAFGFAAARSTHADRLRTIKRMHDRGILVDPHTADGIVACERLRKEGEITVCLSTASHLKFRETMMEALGAPIKMPKAHGPMLDASQRALTIKPDVGTLKDIIRQHALSA